MWYFAYGSNLNARAVAEWCRHHGHRPPPLKGGKPELVVDLKDFNSWGSGVFWMGLDPTDKPLMLRYTGSDDIYALTLEEK